MVVFTLNIWRHYLYVVHCEVFTDRHSLQYNFSQKDINLRQHRLMELLKDYDMKILYHSGKKNAVVDPLSQKEVSKGTLTLLAVEEQPLASDIQPLANQMV